MHTNPITFYAGDSILYAQPLKKAQFEYNPSEKILIGNGYVDNAERLIQEPFDFTLKNKFALTDQHEMLKQIMFPQDSNWNLTTENYMLLYRYMSQRPSESRYPDYSKDSIPDAYCKFLMFGATDKIPQNMRIFNKIGQAYGFLTDNAYIIDFVNNIEFLLSATILVNDNEIYNDGLYEYDSLGFPFMRNLGRAIYEYELGRRTAIKPNLSRFKINYK